MVDKMMESRQHWYEISNFVSVVMKRKELDHRRRQRGWDDPPNVKKYASNEGDYDHWYKCFDDGESERRTSRLEPSS